VTDNGPLRAGKATLYEGGVRVCSFATWPGRIPAGKMVEQPIHIVDWYPTLLKLAGGSFQQTLPIDGKDIWPVLVAGAKSPHDALLISGISPGNAALRSGDWKFHHTTKAVKGPTDEYQLYNLANDIGEKNNLAGSNPEKLAEMKELLRRLLEDAVPSGEKRTLGKAGKKSQD
jgi:arylsulfatase A-like enzyme